MLFLTRSNPLYIKKLPYPVSLWGANHKLNICAWGQIKEGKGTDFTLKNNIFHRLYIWPYHRSGPNTTAPAPQPALPPPCPRKRRRRFGRRPDIIHFLSVTIPSLSH